MATQAIHEVRIEDVDGRAVAACDGPLAGGQCPMVEEGEAIPCAGRLVRPATSLGRAGWEMRVSPAATDCPLRTRRVWAKEPGRRWGPSATTA